MLSAMVQGNPVTIIMQALALNIEISNQINSIISLTLIQKGIVEELSVVECNSFEV